MQLLREKHQNIKVPYHYLQYEPSSLPIKELFKLALSTLHFKELKSLIIIIKMIDDRTKLQMRFTHTEGVSPKTNHVGRLAV